MKRMLIAAGIALILTLSPPAAASTAPALTINGVCAGSDTVTALWNNTTYVSLREVSTALNRNAQVTWTDGVAYVNSTNLSLSARPGDTYMVINGKTLAVPHGVRLFQNRTMVPVRVLAQAFDATVNWNSSTRHVSLFTNSATEKEDEKNYSADELYWLSRIISAESQGEPLEGKIAVGNVVLNRVTSPDFPDTIYGVIFDNRWGGQFEPVRNGTIYQTPTEESVRAAQMCLEGTNVVGKCLYFLAPALAQNFWVVQNREYVTTIGCHDFYN